MFGRTPKGKTKCMKCSGSGTESYQETVPVGGATNRTRTATKTRSCSVCGGLGYQ
jgi:hypothetical protein